MKNNPRKLELEKIAQENKKKTANMVFSEDKFYKDPNVAHFKAGVVYEVVGLDMIERWLKRGGKIVENVKAGVVLEAPKAEPVKEEKPDQEQVDEVVEPVAEQEESSEDDEEKEEKLQGNNKRGNNRRR